MARAGRGCDPPELAAGIALKASGAGWKTALHCVPGSRLIREGGSRNTLAMFYRDEGKWPTVLVLKSECNAITRWWNAGPVERRSPAG